MCLPIPIMLSFMIQHTSIHVHTCIHDCLVRFGSLLVNLGRFRGQILYWHLYASRWNPRGHEFSPLYYKFVPYRSTSFTLIERSVIGTIYVCYFVLFYYFLAYFVNISLAPRSHYEEILTQIGPIPKGLLGMISHRENKSLHVVTIVILMNKLLGHG